MKGCCFIASDPKKKKTTKNKAGLNGWTHHSLNSSQLSLALGGAILFVIQRGTLLLLLLHTLQHSKVEFQEVFFDA